ncbi:MAG: protoheme IX farnesyltransferase [Bacteroidales bacterium]|jgi:protoheme IX farnesyltransferase|nr:protoheme IX farnesyltransferase [Bacteroidales bacterium]
MAFRLTTLASLTKYRLSAAVAFSAVTGYFLAGRSPDATLAYAAAGVFILSSGAAALNQYTERKPDGRMGRTSGRPLPSGSMNPRSALLISVILVASGSLVLSLAGIVPLFLGLVNVILYNGVYTSLKKISVLAIIPGALVGAIPPLIGYASAGGKVTDPVIAAFALFMFLWQLPHFWLLLIKYGNEYEEAGFASLSSFMSQAAIRIMVFIWVLISTAFLALFLSLIADLALPLVIATTIFNSIFIILFYRMLFRKEDEIRGAFIMINIFGILLMLFLIGAAALGAI